MVGHQQPAIRGHGVQRRLDLGVEFLQRDLGGGDAGGDPVAVATRRDQRLAEGGKGGAHPGRIEPHVRIAVERLDVVAHPHQRDATVLHRGQGVVEPLLQAEPVGDDERGVVEHLPIAQRRLVGVGVGSGRQQRPHLERAVTGRLPHEIGPDRGGRDDVRAPVGLRRRVAVAAAPGGGEHTRHEPGGEPPNPGRSGNHSQQAIVAAC